MAGCRGGGETEERPTLTVYAAASLIDAVGEAGSEFAKDHDARIEFNFAASGTLARQILAARGADVFISANAEWMERVEAAGRLVPGSRRKVCGNRLVVATSDPNAPPLADAAALASLPVRHFAIGDPAFVPAGAYARSWMKSVRLPGDGTLWEAMKDRLLPMQDVRAVLMQVESSPAIPGIVYRSDTATRGGRVRIILEIAVPNAPEVSYPAAAVADGNQALATAFLDYLQSAKSLRILERHGFVVD